MKKFTIQNKEFIEDGGKLFVAMERSRGMYYVAFDIVKRLLGTRDIVLDNNDPPKAVTPKIDERKRCRECHELGHRWDGCPQNKIIMVQIADVRKENPGWNSEQVANHLKLSRAKVNQLWY